MSGPVRLHRIDLVLLLVLALTVAAFAGAYAAEHGFWAELLLVLGGSGLAAVIAVWGVETLLTWGEEDRWASVREQLLNRLRRDIERLALFLHHEVGSDPHLLFMDRDKKLLTAEDPMPQEIVRLLEGVTAAPLTSWRGLHDGARPWIERIRESLVLAPAAHLGEDVILKVGRIDRERGHWETHLGHAAHAPELATLPYVLGLFVKAITDAYDAVATELREVRLVLTQTKQSERSPVDA